MQNNPVLTDSFIADWETKTEYNRHDLLPGHIEFSKAMWELEAATEEYTYQPYKADRTWQMAYWRDWFNICKAGQIPAGTKICVREINKLRGRR